MYSDEEIDEAEKKFWKGESSSDMSVNPWYSMGFNDAVKWLASHKGEQKQ